VLSEKTNLLIRVYISKERALIISVILAKSDAFAKQILTKYLSYIIINEE